MWGRSIVSNCYADGGNITTPQAEAQREAAWARAETDGPLAYEGVSSNPRDVAVAQWLRAGGIRRVITGHKPAGDSPAICSSGYTGVEVITAHFPPEKHVPRPEGASGRYKAADWSYSKV